MDDEEEGSHFDKGQDLVLAASIRTVVSQSAWGSLYVLT
jgi:hypothetical protein